MGILSDWRFPTLQFCQPVLLLCIKRFARALDRFLDVADVANKSRKNYLSTIIVNGLIICEIRYHRKINEFNLILHYYILFCSQNSFQVDFTE